MTAVAAVLAALAAALAVRREGTGRRRLAGFSSPDPGPPSSLSASAACLVAGGAAVAVLGFPLGPVVGVAVAVVGPLALRRLEPAADRRERAQLVAELPLLLDLLGACLAGGASLRSAAASVAAALPGPVARRLALVVRSLDVGAPPADAWLALAGTRTDDPLGPAARLLGRAGDGGTPVAAVVGRLAQDARAAAAAEASRAARRVGVLAVAPLGLCFLPAFVLLGIVPVVSGLAAPLFRTF